MTRKELKYRMKNIAISMRAAKAKCKLLKKVKSKKWAVDSQYPLELFEEVCNLQLNIVTQVISIIDSDIKMDEVSPVVFKKCPDKSVPTIKTQLQYILDTLRISIIRTKGDEVDNAIANAKHKLFNKDITEIYTGGMGGTNE